MLGFEATGGKSFHVMVSIEDRMELTDGSNKIIGVPSLSSTYSFSFIKLATKRAPKLHANCK